MATSMPPYFTDRCAHDRPRDRFLGTVVVGNNFYDVYVYQDNALDAAVPDMHVCLRYGEKPSEYISPGPVARFMSIERPNTVYLETRPLIAAWLKRKMDATWTREDGGDHE